MPKCVNRVLGMFRKPSADRLDFLHVARRTTGIASVNNAQLGQLPVWVPPLPFQTAFAEQVQRIEATARALDAAAAKAKAEVMPTTLSTEMFG